MENERYQSVDMDEIYYITDTQKLNKTYEDFLKDYEGPMRISSRIMKERNSKRNTQRMTGENTCLKTAWMGQKLWKL